MVVKFRNRKTEPSLKKVLIYGMDGSGKSTFAEKYCEKNGLSAVVLDIDDTNYTNLPLVELNFDNDVTTYNSVKNNIKELGKMDEFDTIILDGVTSLLEMLTSKAKGMAQYSDRSKRWNDILRTLLATKKNLIFIGQIDMELIYTPDAQSSKAVIKVNSMVNEKYLTYIDKDGNYCSEVKKMRTISELEAASTREEVPAEPTHQDEVKVDPTRNSKQKIVWDSNSEIAHSIVAEALDLTSAKTELFRLMKEGIVSKEDCPIIVKEIERLMK